MLYFATLFNINYFSRGNILYHSLKKHCPQFTLFILCLDEETFIKLSKRKEKNIVPIKISNIENYEPELKEIKKQRKPAEYFFTLSPVLPAYILDKYPHVNKITSLDADICFYNNPAVLLNQYSDYSILITPHKFSKHLKDREKFGLYNVSFQSFKRNEDGLNCLKEWKRQCLDWCFDYFEDGKYADQKYLDDWAVKYKNVKVIDHPGAGLAPWNIKDVEIVAKDKNNYSIKGEHLIYYHFHGLRFISPRLVYTGLQPYGVHGMSKGKSNLYYQYIRLLKKNNTDKHIPRNTHQKKKISQLFRENGYVFYLPFGILISTISIGKKLASVKRIILLKFIWQKY